MDGSPLGLLWACCYLLLFQGAGLCLAALALPWAGAGPRLLWGSVLGSALFHWLPALYAFGLGFTLPAHLLAAGTAALFGAACLWRARRARLPGYRGALGAFGRHPFLWAALAFTAFFAFLVWKGFLWRDGRVYSSQATYGDMSMHLSFITSLARQGAFPPEYPLLPGHLLSYPFLGDSVSASLLLLGAPLNWAYWLPMALAGAQVFFGFYLLALRLTSRPQTAALAWGLFFLNGGLGFLYFLGSPEEFGHLFTDFYRTPTNLVEENIRWVNVIVDMMLPQRATLFGWAVLFPTLALLAEGVFQGRRRAFPLAGLLAGALPMIHTHSFLALGLICAAWLLGDLLRALSLGRRAVWALKALIALGLPGMWALQRVLRATGSLDAPALLWVVAVAAGAFALGLAALALAAARRGMGRAVLLPWGALLGVTLALALPQLLVWTFPQAGAGGFLRGHFGWAIGEDEYPLFYLKNLGLAGPLALAALLAASPDRFRRIAPAPLIWFVAELMEFQPNDYDNNKLLYVAYALLCCGAAALAWDWLGRCRSKGVRRALAGAGALVCSLSAWLTMGREAVSQYELFGEGALAVAHFVEAETAPSDLVLTDTRHNNEVAALAGRGVVCGSPSYLYFHGLPYARNEAAVRQMYEEPAQAAEWFRYFDIRWVLVSDFERSSYQVDQAYFDAHWDRAYDDGGRVVYRARGDGA